MSVRPTHQPLPLGMSSFGRTRGLWEACGQPEVGHQPSPHSSAEPGPAPVGIKPTEENPDCTTDNQGALGEHIHGARLWGPAW